jgi:hypothetical protein
MFLWSVGSHKSYTASIPEDSVLQLHNLFLDILNDFPKAYYRYCPHLCVCCPCGWLTKTDVYKTGGDCKYSCTILDIDTGWWTVVSFTLRPLYLRRKNNLLLFDGRPKGPQSRSGSNGGERIVLSSNPSLSTPRRTSRCLPTVPWINQKWCGSKGLWQLICFCYSPEPTVINA